MAYSGASEVDSKVEGGIGATEPMSKEEILVNAKERVAKAEEYKKLGNDLYKKKESKAAIGKYHRALLYLKDLDSVAMRRSMREAFGVLDRGDKRTGKSEKWTSLPKDVMDKAKDLETSCYNNLAACLLLQPEPNYKKVDHYCTQVLHRNDRNEKALYRRGVALYHLRDYEQAQQNLCKAQEISQGDANVKKYLQLCEAAISKQAKAERTRYKGMFDKMAADSGDHL